MSTAAQEQAFYDAVVAAEAVRQNSIATAQATYGFVKSRYAQFIVDLVSAQTTYATSVIAAAGTSIDPFMGVAGPIQCARTAKLGGN